MTTLAPARTAPLGGGRRPLWLSAAAGLVLHAGLALAWWLVPHDATHVVPPTPMTVRLTELSQVAQAPKSAAPAQRPKAPAPEAARPQPARAQGGARTATATTTAQVSQAPPAAPAPVPATRAQATLPVPPLAPASPVAPPPVSAHAAPAADAPHPTPGVTGSTGAPAQATAATAGDAKAPVDMPSASISYLVQPVLTFPPGSEDLGESGSVTVRVLVDEKGVPTKVERVKSSGYPRLDQQAVSVIRRARFVPHQVQGEARAAWATVTLNFNLH